MVAAQNNAVDQARRRARRNGVEGKTWGRDKLAKGTANEDEIKSEGTKGEGQRVCAWTVA